MNLHGTQRSEGDQLLLTLAGEIDVYSTKKLRELLHQVIPEQTGPFIIDLAGVTSIESSGPGVLGSATRRCREKGTNLGLRNPRSVVRKIVQHLRLDQAFTIEPAAGAVSITRFASPAVLSNAALRARDGTPGCAANRPAVAAVSPARGPAPPGFHQQ